MLHAIFCHVLAFVILAFVILVWGVGGAVVFVEALAQMDVYNRPIRWYQWLCGAPAIVFLTGAVGWLACAAVHGFALWICGRA